MHDLPQTISIVENEDIKGKHLIFSISDVSYGIEIEYVTEIIGIQPITPVPNTPDYVKGVTNIRGTIVPVVDMRILFALGEKNYDERTCIVLIGGENMHIGIIVDAVEDVLKFAPEDILPPKRSSTGEKSIYIKAIGKIGGKVKQIIDIYSIFQTDVI